MSRLYHETLTVVRNRLSAASPAKANELSMKTGSAALRDPDNRRNIFFATVEWPTDDDPGARVGLRANFPKERLKNGQGYLGVTFSHGERIDLARMDTKLKVLYGIGGIGLLEPIGVYMTETLESATGNETEPLWSPASPEAAAVVLEKFGIAEA